LEFEGIGSEVGDTLRGTVSHLWMRSARQVSVLVGCWNGQRKRVIPIARRHLFALGSGPWPGCTVGSVWCGAAISRACSRHMRYLAVPATRRVRDR